MTRPARTRKPPLPVCNCPATAEKYGRPFPHRAGNVAGCHMGQDGLAKDGVPRPGCHCRACDMASAILNAGNRNAWSAADLQEQWGGAYRRPLWPTWMGKDWETAYAAHQQHVEGVTP